MSDVRIFNIDEWVHLGPLRRHDTVVRADIVLVHYPGGMYVEKNRFPGATKAGRWLWRKE